MVKQLLNIGKAFCGIILGLMTLAEVAQATTYFMSPSGSDSNNGIAITSPWKTFKYALSNLDPGDTLTLLNGTYDTSNSGYPAFTVNGTATQPITIKAQNERQAWIKGNGSTHTVQVSNSSYLVLDGLRISSVDLAAGNSSVPLRVDSSHHLKLTRNLIHNPNRYFNTHPIVLIKTFDSLLEENEIYNYHRHGILLYQSARNTIRRCYCNPRIGGLAGGYANGAGSAGADGCLALYPAYDNIVENTVADGSPKMVKFAEVNASGESVNTGNRFYGIIGYNTWYGITIQARGNDTNRTPQSTHIRDMALINTQVVGLYSRSARDTRCDQCTVIGSGNSGIIAEQYGAFPGDGKYSFFGDNILSVNNKLSGVLVTAGVQTSIVDHPNAFGNQVNYNPTTSPKWVASRTIDPVLGACQVWIPDNSPMKKAGKNGADIGANILYRYENGVLTSKPLWDPITGEFPHGAIVVGLNDVPGQSLFDVHKRLNVNTNGCSFPASYGKNTDTTPPQSPQNVAVR